MARNRRFTRWLVLLATLSLLHATACGTLLYPERGGQPEGRVDPAVVLLDGALLLVFVVPGLVAFGIDFYTGAIYFPTGARDVTVIQLPPGELSAPNVEALLRTHTGYDLSLDDPAWRRYELGPGGDPVAILRAWQEAGASALASLQPAR